MIHAQLEDLIKSNSNFAIIAHTSPDGDCMGSMLSLYSVLISLDKNVDLLIDDKLPEKFSFLPYYEKINLNPPKSYDVIFILDCGDLDRIGKYQSLVKVCNNIVNIDHHITNTNFGNINIVDKKASSTGEMVYRTLSSLGFKLTLIAAICIYTAMLTDTGGFKYSNTSPKTLEIAGELISFGFDFTEINDVIFNRKSEEKVRLISKITSTLDLQLKGRVAILNLSKEMLELCNAKEEDADEVVNIGRDINGVEVSVFIKEKNSDTFRVSLRSNKYVDVSKIASSFGGGGHIRAAGLSFNGSFEAVKQNLLAEIEKQLVNI